MIDEIAPKDIVMLRSGGPDMVAHAKDDEDNWVCTWLDEKGIYDVGAFPSSTLVRLKRRRYLNVPVPVNVMERLRA
jgi:uncharacterized protein YodC (DUF2158 family)